MTNYEKRQLRNGLLFISPWIIGFLIFTLYPVVSSLYYALCDYDILTSPIFIGFKNFITIWHDDIFWQTLYNTFIYAAFSIPIGLITSLFFAILLNCNVKCRPVFRAIYFLPSLLPVVASSMIWLWIFNSSFGLLNYGLSVIGISGPSWLTDAVWTKPAVIIMSVWGIGNAVVIYLAALQDVPRALYEAADIDGASFLSKLRHITIPMISPVIYFNLIMSIIYSFQIFAQTFVLFEKTQGSGPNNSALFYSVYMYSNAFQFNKMGYACAMGWILFVIILILTLITTRAVRKKIYYGG